MRNNSTAFFKKLSLLGTSLSTLSLVALSLGVSPTKAFGDDCSTTTSIKAACTLPTTSSSSSTFTLGTNNVDGALITSPTSGFSNDWTGTISVAGNVSLEPTITSADSPAYITADITSTGTNTGTLVQGSSLTLTNNGTIYITANQLNSTNNYNAIDLAAATVKVTNAGNFYGVVSDSNDNNATRLLTITADTLTFINSQDKNLSVWVTMGTDFTFTHTYETLHITTKSEASSTLTNSGTISVEGDGFYTMSRTIELAGSGPIQLTNESTGKITNTTNYYIHAQAIDLSGESAFTLINNGRISVRGSNPQAWNQYNTALNLAGSGVISITNNKTASIYASNTSGSTSVIDFSGANTFTLTNDGAIDLGSQDVLHGTVGIAMNLKGTGAINITNNKDGVIKTAYVTYGTAIDFSGANTFTLTNDGVIATLTCGGRCASNGGTAINLKGPGAINITNNKDGEIKAENSYNTAIDFSGANTFTLTNDGVITAGTQNTGQAYTVVLEGKGDVNLTNSASASIIAHCVNYDDISAAAIWWKQTAGVFTLINSGTITGDDAAIVLGTTSTETPNTITLRQNSVINGSIFGSGIYVGMDTTTDVLNIEVGTTDSSQKNVSLQSGFTEGFDVLHISETKDAKGEKKLNAFIVSTGFDSDVANHLIIDPDVTLVVPYAGPYPFSINKDTKISGTLIIENALYDLSHATLNEGGTLILRASNGMNNNIEGSATAGYGALKTQESMTLEGTIQNLAGLEVDIGTLNYAGTVDDEAFTANGLYVASGATMSLEQNSKLVIRNSAFIGGTLNATQGKLTLAGNLTLLSGGTLDAPVAQINLTGSSIMQLYDSATATIASLSMDADATLEGVGTLTISGASTFAGTLYPMTTNNASVLNLSVASTFTAQTGAKFQTQLNGDSATPSINVTAGTLDLSVMTASDFSLGVTPSLVQQLVQEGKKTFDLITTSSNGKLTLPTLGVSVNNLFYSVQLRDGTSKLQAVLEVENGGKLATVSGFSDNNKVLGAFFDQLYAQPSVDFETAATSLPLTLENIYQSLVNTHNVHEAADILNQLQPQVYGDVEQEVGNVSSQFTTLMMSKVTDELSSNIRDFHITLSPVFNYTKRGEDSGQFGTKSWDVGLNLALSKRLGDHFVVGGSFQYDHTNLDLDSVSQSAKSENISVGAFVGYTMKGLFKARSQDKLMIQGSLAYTAGVGSVDRTVAIVNYAGLNPLTHGTYSSKPHVNAFRFTAQGEYAFRIPGHVDIGPYVRLDLGSLSRDALYEESDAIDTRASVESSSHFTGNLIIGGHVQWRLDTLAMFAKEAAPATDKLTFKTFYHDLIGHLTLDGSLGWSGQLGSQSRDVNYMLGNRNGDLTVAAHDAPGLGGALWSLGAHSQINSPLGTQTIGLRYDGSFAAPGTQVSNAVSLTIGMAF